MGKRALENDKKKGPPPAKRKARGKLVKRQNTTDWNKSRSFTSSLSKAGVAFVGEQDLEALGLDIDEQIRLG